MSRLRKAARATIVVQAFNWAGLLLSFVTVPLYLSWLGQERYGLLLTGLAFASYLMFADAGINWASILLIAQASGRDDRAAIGSIMRNSFSLAVCSALLVLGIVTLLQWMLKANQYVIWLPKHPEFPGLLFAIGSSVACNLGASPFYNLFIGLQEAHLAAIYQGSGRILGAVAAVLVASTHAPLGWVFSANVAAALLTGCIAAAHCWRRHPWAFDVGPIWEWAEIRQQLRTGSKSFTMQVGNVLLGTAPVLAISACAGPQYVPYYSIPLTVLNAPLSILASFSASLQPGYGEAMGRGETQWIIGTVRRLLRHVLLILGLVGCGFLLLGGPFIRFWTDGRIEVSVVMLVNVFGVSVVTAVLTVFRFALTGINRHRQLAVGDFVSGALAIASSFIVVQKFGYQWVGCAGICALALTTGWIAPREFNRTIGAMRIWPNIRFWLRWGIAVCVAFVVGGGVMHLLSGFALWASMPLAAVTIIAIYVLVVYVFFRHEGDYAVLSLNSPAPADPDQF